MDDLTPEDLELMLAALTTARLAHRRLYSETAATAADREVSKHYRRVANNDANWHADEVSRLSRLETKLERMLAQEREAA